MLGEPGIYFVYKHHYNGERQERQIIGRFYIHSNVVKILEDYDGTLKELIPNGQITPMVLKRMRQLSASPYWDIISEDDINQGHDEIPEVKLVPDEWEEKRDRPEDEQKS